MEEILDSTAPDRIAALGPEFFGSFGVLALDGAFDKHLDNSINARNLAHKGLMASVGIVDDRHEEITRPITPQEAQTFGAYVGQGFIGQAHERSQDVTRRAAIAAEVKVLKWLGSIRLLNNDESSSQNVVTALRFGYGVRGKIAAAQLWYELKLRS